MGPPRNVDLVPFLEGPSAPNAPARGPNRAGSRPFIVRLRPVAQIGIRAEPGGDWVGALTSEEEAPAGTRRRHIALEMAQGSKPNGKRFGFTLDELAARKPPDVQPAVYSVGPSDGRNLKQRNTSRTCKGSSPT